MGGASLGPVVLPATPMTPPSPLSQVILVDAGHCPHDEQPEKVNAALLQFIEARVLNGSATTHLWQRAEQSVQH